MRSSLPFCLAALVMAAALVGGPAAAGTERVPAQGAPALVVTLPPGWQPNRHQNPVNDELDAGAPDHSSMVLVAITTVQGAMPPLAEMAAGYAQGLHTQLTARSEVATIGGHFGRAFFMQSPAAAGRPATEIKAVFAVLDATHVALVSVTQIAAATPGQRARAAAVAQGVSVVMSAPAR